MYTVYKFQTLEIYRQALDYMDCLSAVADGLPGKRAAGLGERLLDAATHLVVQIAAKSSGDSEIARSFMVEGALMSLYETIACLDIVERRKLLPTTRLRAALDAGKDLHAALVKIKKSLGQR